MNLIVLYFVVIQNCLQIALLQETQASDFVTQNNESSKSVTHKDETEPVEVNKLQSDSLSESNPTHDEEAKNDLDYPFNTLMRLLKVKGSVTDSFDGASKIFDGMQDVGGELFGMVKDGTLNFKKYLPFK